MAMAYFLFVLLLSLAAATTTTAYVTPLTRQHLLRSLMRRSSDDSPMYPPVYVGPQQGLKAADHITTLPGQPAGLCFNQYSGYVTVDPAAGRALFYYFAESGESASTKPLVLWLSGGPGCSSLGEGAMTELGPFRVTRDGKSLTYNPYAWNTAANVIFLESPAGVGFSYSNTTSDYNTTGDIRTAADSYAFLLNWLERFPEYKGRDFYITGESYVGHYAPQLAQLILRKNKLTSHTVINLKGILMGNPLMNMETWNRGAFEYLWSHAMIPEEVYEGILSSCNFSSIQVSAACLKFNIQAEDAAGEYDPFNIYAPLCDTESPPKTTIREIGSDPCWFEYLKAYFNTPQVKSSLHANAMHGNWSECNVFVGTHWTDRPFSVLPIVKELSASGIRVWIFSGDVDAVVPFTTTRYDIAKMRLAMKTPWYPWYIKEHEVGGSAIGYENLTFVTVRQAGHKVPRDQPARALTVFSSFLKGKLPPSRWYVVLNLIW